MWEYVQVNMNRAYIKIQYFYGNYEKTIEEKSCAGTSPR